jgi:TonB family protein
MTLRQPFKTIIVVFLLTAASWSQALPGADELIKAINDRPNLWSLDRPFHLEADFVTQLDKPETGHVSWKYQVRGKWKQEISLVRYQQITVQNGDEEFTARNLSYSPLAIREIRQLFVPVRVETSKWEVKKLKQTEHGSVACLELQKIPKDVWKREVCLDTSTKRVISDETKNDSSSTKYEYSDYLPFLGQEYPRTLKFFREGSPVLTIVVTALEERSYTDADFVPPANAIVRKKCLNMIRPKVIKDPDPTYPVVERASHHTGTSIVSLTVLPDGSVDDVHLIGSSYPGMNEITQQIVKEWKFKPAMCGSEPVATDIEVDVNFRLR